MFTSKQAQEMATEIDTGARNPTGWQTNLIPLICFTWALYQLYTASPLPSMLSEYTGVNFFYFIANLSISRKLHLAFALVLAALAYPLFRSSPRDRVPAYDWALLALGVLTIFYMLVMNTNIAERAGDFVHPNIRYDMTVAVVGIFVLASCVYRALGLPMIVVASVLVAYVFIGGGNWGGASFVKGTWHFWMQEEGIFGKPLEVSAQTIFLFVLFGAILEKAGAGAYFIKIAFALLGHLRGGPAKAAVIASAMSGLYSGSSIANTVTTGTFTIPLMKKTGLSAEKAGAIEVASSTNGQLTPPVMGAAAFLIAEFTGIQYIEILQHALVPALVSYIALIYIVHLEACKLDLRRLPKPPSSLTFATRLIGVLGGFIGIGLLMAIVHSVKSWVTQIAPGLTLPYVVFVLGIAYLALLWVAAKRPDLEEDDPDAPVLVLPPAGATAVTGIYYLLPIILLLWCILPTPEKLSAHLSAFYACLAITFVALTQKPLKAVMRGSGNLGEQFRRGVCDWKDGMIAGARNMIAIAIATAAAGIIIGSISLTGAHQVVGEFVEFLSGGSLIIMLVLVALMSLILGMGLPTTANYIVVSSLMVPVIITLGAKSGFIVPLIAVHLFVFYFGILADDTPPVGLAAFAAAAISKGDPIKTGIQGFAYDIRTALLPFMFIFNTELLLIDVSWVKALFVFVVAVIAMMLFASATQGYLLTRNKRWESVALLLVAFTLFRPGYWLDQVAQPHQSIEPDNIYAVVGQAKPGDVLTMVISGPDFDSGEVGSRTILAPLGESAEAAKRLEQADLIVTLEDGFAKIGEPPPGTPMFEKIGTAFDYYADEPVRITDIRQPAERMPKEVFYIPAITLFGVIVWRQRRRLAVVY